MKTMLATLACLPILACTQINDVREATVDVALTAYRVNACASGPVGELARDQLRADTYAANGVYVEADCQWKPGDTIDAYLARRLPSDP